MCRAHLGQNYLYNFYFKWLLNSFLFVSLWAETPHKEKERLSDNVPELLTHPSNMSDVSTLTVKRFWAQGLSSRWTQMLLKKGVSTREEKTQSSSQNVLILNLSTKFDSAVSWVLSSTPTKCEIDQMNGDQVMDEHTDRDRDPVLYSRTSLQIAQRRDLTRNATAASSSSLCLPQIHPLRLFFSGHPVVIKQMGRPDVWGWVEPPRCSAGAADGSVLLQQQQKKKKSRRGESTRDASLRTGQGCYVLVLQIFYRL